MNIEYICHACLSIDVGGLRIATDPWFNGPAYCGQWNVFPKPVNTDALAHTDLILLSHGHEDHFHVPTLEKLPKTARVLYPYNWYGGVKPFLRELGFEDVLEAPTHKTIRLTSDTSVTYILNNLDSIVVIESDGKVFVNVNDALHSYPPGIVDQFVGFLRERWPRIDTVFCGFGGASYFPNTVHCLGKDDQEIGEAREQMFVHAFCRIVHGLRPAVAVPFAADFALLHPDQRWINNSRFPRSLVANYYRKVYGEFPGSPRILDMYPGDVLASNELLPKSPYREQLRDGQLNHLIEEQYANEIAASQQQNWLAPSASDALENEILANMRLRAPLLDPRQLGEIEFSLRVPDVLERPHYNISFRDGISRLERSAAPAPGAILEISIPSSILRYSFASEWGGDAITIGYGCDIRIFREEIIKSNLDVLCIQLLTRIPAASRHWRKEPARMARYILSSPFNRSWAAQAVRAKLRGEPSANEHNEKMREWLLRTKCEVCRACDLPLLDQGFAEGLN